MTATAFLVTLVFLYSDGTPARDAYIACSPMRSYIIGFDDTAPLSSLGTATLQLDARGGNIVTVDYPTTINCDAAGRDEVWTGAIALAPNQKVITLTLWTAED